MDMYEYKISRIPRVKIPCSHPLVSWWLMHTGSGDPHEYLPCDGCGDTEGNAIYCKICKFRAHFECIIQPDIINHPCHSKHPLKKVLAETIDYTDGNCHFCRRPLDEVMYHCSICNISIDLSCWIYPPPFTIYQPKSHNHTFTLMARKDSFTCNACGLVGDRNPYVCLECDFMLHKDCIDLPRVININRHDHRISRTYHLGHGDWKCGVCRKHIDWIFGGYSCKRCPSYAVHSKCATRGDVWEGEELEDEPEDEEIEDPYKVINEKEILHFSHEHNLRLGDDNAADNEKCHACVFPINSDPFYQCVQCKFLLHKVCATLPRKKRNILHNHKLDLQIQGKPGEVFECSYCLQFFDGFRYECKSSGRCNGFFSLDMRCGSISEPFHHELHPHPLYRTSAERKTCGACGKDSEYVLSCIVCEFALGMECATLPRKVKHRCDDHFLSLHHGAENSSGQLWCDICEGKTDPSVWFYGCDDCGNTLHINCVLGDMYYFKPGNRYGKAEVVANVGMTRPFCVVCGKRCIFSSFLKATTALDLSASDSTVLYSCSIECAYERGPYRDAEPKWYYESQR
ncbi:unnamed protein product [Arabidopsis thaliana]|uniref:Zinc finger PHD-type domain-containing protein n=1 Tax=Arabidopsis thaliana TaxID=3702 RepID=A0A654EKL5_ARATH|nr:unnamed protein product [Arabidopsis thaliana]